MAAVAVTKTENDAFAPGANEESVTVGAGAARHWPVLAFVWHRVTTTGSDGFEPVEVETVMEGKL